jgi:hypothetical protein
MEENSLGWRSLDERMQSLAFLTSGPDYGMNGELQRRYKGYVHKSECTCGKAHLPRNMENLAESIKQAEAHGKLNKFFNSTDDSSYLSQYNTDLSDIIADITVSIVLYYSVILPIHRLANHKAEICVKMHQNSVALHDELAKFRVCIFVI